MARVYKISLIKNETIKGTASEVFDNIQIEVNELAIGDYFTPKDPNVRHVVLKVGETANKILGYCECDRVDNSCEIIISSAIENVFSNKNIMSYVFLHEIGHAFGIGHSEDKSDIMNEFANRKDFSKITIDQQKGFLLKLIHP